MADSVHLARFLGMFSDHNLEMRLVSSSPHRRLHPEIVRLLATSENQLSLSMPVLSKALSLPMWLLDRFLSDFLRGLVVAIEILKFKPNFVHANELQNAGYAAARAYSLLPKKLRPPLVATNYGSELQWYGEKVGHRRKIIRLLSYALAFSAECQRDYDLARQLGFSGLELELIPIAGGAPVMETGLAPRGSVAVKGYQNRWGQALQVLKELEKHHAQFIHLEFVFFSCNLSVMLACRMAQARGRLRIRFYGKGRLSHSDVLGLLQNSLAYIGFSKSDGISTSMLEAMSCGAIPIQTSTSCANEWLDHGQTGYLVSVTNVEEVSRALLEISSGSLDVNRARLANFKLMRNRYDPERIRQVALRNYQTILSYEARNGF